MITVQQSLIHPPNKKDIKPRKSNQATTNQTQAIAKDEFKHANNKKYHPKKEKPHLALLVGTLTVGLLLIAGIAKRKELQQWWHSFHTQPKPSPQPTTTVPIPPPIIPPISLTLEERIQEQLRLAEEVFGKLGIQFTKQEKADLLTSDKPTEAIWQFTQEKIERANNRSLEDMAWDLNYRGHNSFGWLMVSFPTQLQDKIKRQNGSYGLKLLELICAKKEGYQAKIFGNVTVKEFNRQFDQLYAKRVLEFLAFAEKQPIKQCPDQSSMDVIERGKLSATNKLKEMCNAVLKGELKLTGKKMEDWFESIPNVLNSMESYIENKGNKKKEIIWSNHLRCDWIVYDQFCQMHPTKHTDMREEYLRASHGDLFEALKKEALNYLEKIKAFNEP